MKKKHETEWTLVQRDSDILGDEVWVWLEEHGFEDEEEPGANSLIIGFGKSPVEAWQMAAEQFRKYTKMADKQVKKLSGTIGGHARRS